MDKLFEASFGRGTCQFDRGGFAAPSRPQRTAPDGRPARRHRTIFISDTHLGTRGCKAEVLGYAGERDGALAALEEAEGLAARVGVRPESEVAQAIAAAHAALARA